MPKATPYLLAALLGMAAGAGIEHLIGAHQLADEQAARALDAQRHAEALGAISRAALDAEQRAIATHDAAASAVAAVDQRTTREKNEHEAENRSLRAALAAGTERLRVAVRNCTAADRDGMSGASSAAGMGDGAAAYADVDAAVAERVFGVAGDDQREIDKLTALQGYVCAVRPETPSCEDKK
ncbi:MULTISPECIES: lysis system i-spanin subunit Rz [pseudomallei group]|uniref:lysis system i-spanin subunit Rz n=1 Tax=pseudomallei group TaxID=111527 RepID=UPI0012E8B242|nr:MULTISPECIES: lysis system i-spanin subunit Rz [pseudomallei group]MCS3397723.1 lysis system i-spanin subunit Rz [Burkholderia thailandensis]MCV9914854.1 lysis system i-spanin subunit Rz [Burkholderia pseudomallei]MCW0071121.1 lysis system i-spanin subunit Rz [Burkholderia pseudomallei]MDW9238676.1 bacteriophage lysis family protein [Burkholderia thailandensis]MUV28206.1 lysozyme [Burkholderia thailandensis]